MATGKKSQGKSKLQTIFDKLPKREQNKLLKQAEQAAGQLTPKQAKEIVAKQNEKARLQKIEKRAKKAISAFRPRKSDRGAIVFVGVNGSREARYKGRKGFAVYIDRKGRKFLQADVKNGYSPGKLAGLSIPVTKRTKRAVKEFYNELSTVVDHRFEKQDFKRRKKEGRLRPTEGTENSFSDKVVTKMAKSLAFQFRHQMSQRRFLLKVMVLVKGVKNPYEIVVPIEKADHIAIELGGMRNFIFQKFYALFAKQLAFDGLVTSGSANHIRDVLELKPGQKFTRQRWEQYHREQGHTGPDGEDLEWRAQKFKTVEIDVIEWVVEKMNGITKHKRKRKKRK